jgi:hypothetical protein
MPARSTSTKAVSPSFSTESDTITITWVDKMVLEMVTVVQVVSTLVNPLQSTKVTRQPHSLLILSQPCAVQLAKRRLERAATGTMSLIKR